MDERNLIAILLVAAFVSAALVFWVSVQAVNSALLNRIASVRSAQSGNPPAARYSSVR